MEWIIRSVARHFHVVDGVQLQVEELLYATIVLVHEERGPVGGGAVRDKQHQDWQPLRGWGALLALRLLQGA